MDSLRRRRHRLLAAAAAAVALLFLVSALGCGLTRTAQEGEQGRRHLDLDDRRGWRRVLVGPGSSPPTCRGRCGGCLPCRPVHVAVQPSRSFPLEYYPEAWRCKCGNRLFMP